MSLPRTFARYLTNAYYGVLFRRETRHRTQPYRLHLGCGSNHLDGWINVDFKRQSGVEAVWNIKYELPVEDGSCEYIFHEHVLEHFSLEDGLTVLRQCHRKLKSGGVLRVAMPSLDDMLARCVAETYADDHDENAPRVVTKSEYLNVRFRWWGHKWIYDRAELRRQLLKAGFSSVREAAHRAGAEAPLCNLECRIDSLLICEAVK